MRARQDADCLRIKQTTVCVFTYRHLLICLFISDLSGTPSIQNKFVFLHPMEQEREEQQFEREENDRLRAAFNIFDSLYNKGRERNSVVSRKYPYIAEDDTIGNSPEVSKSKDQLSDEAILDAEQARLKDFSPEETPSFEEDEYEYITDRYIDLFNDRMARVAAEMGFKAYPYSSALLVKYCDAMIIGKELGKALLILDEYKDSFPPNSDIYLSYSRVYIGMKDLENARRYYNMAMEVEASPEDICDSIHTLAQDCMEIEMWNEALFYLDRTRELTSIWNKKHHETEKAENVASFYFDYAFCSEKTGNEDKAAELYKKCLDIDPFNDIVWHNLGIIYSKKSMFKHAYEAFDFAIALNPKNVNALFNMGHLCIECNLLDQGQQYFEDCCKIEKDNPDSISSLALTYFLKGNLEQAEILYRKALIFCPDHQASLKGLTEVQAEKKLREKYKSRHRDNKGNSPKN